MNNFTPTFWRQSYAQQSYSEEPNRPINMPPVGESSIQRFVLPEQRTSDLAAQGYMAGSNESGYHPNNDMIPIAGLGSSTMPFALNNAPALSAGPSGTQ